MSTIPSVSLDISKSTLISVAWTGLDIVQHESNGQIQSMLTKYYGRTGDSLSILEMTVVSLGAVQTRGQKGHSVQHRVDSK